MSTPRPHPADLPTPIPRHEERDDNLFSVPVLHAVTSDEIVRRPGFAESAQEVMRLCGGRIALHLRAPSLEASTVLDIATRLAAGQEESGAWLVIHERVDIAVASGARAVQLTSVSLSPGQVRGIASDLVIGAGAHTVNDAMDGEREGAAWVVLDRVLRARPPGDSTSGPALLAQTVQAVRIPVIALGGVLPPHVAQLCELGAYGVAAIRGIWHTSNAAAAALDYLSAYDARRGTRSR